MQRREHRPPFHKHIKVAGRDLTSLEDCDVIDLSVAGARLSAPPASTVPDAIILVFVKEQLIREAEVRWRRPCELGVVFTGPPLKLDLAESGK
jgi:PilZ domain